MEVGWGLWRACQSSNNNLFSYWTQIQKPQLKTQHQKFILTTYNLLFDILYVHKLYRFQ